jgi:hypothetical protein
VLAIERAVVLQEGERTQGLERFRRAREIRLGVFDDASQRRKDLALSFEDGAHPRIHRQPAEIAAPRDADLPEVSPQRAEEGATRLADRHR